MCGREISLQQVRHNTVLHFFLLLFFNESISFYMMKDSAVSPVSASQVNGSLIEFTEFCGVQLSFASLSSGVCERRGFERFSGRHSLWPQILACSFGFKIVLALTVDGERYSNCGSRQKALLQQKTELFQKPGACGILKEMPVP